VDIGEVDITQYDDTLQLTPGKYLGILTHSGSRGFGATLAKHYVDLAMKKCILPPEAKYLAWLDINTEEGQEYWLAMNLAGDYASACHHDIHKRLAKAIGEKPITMVENHHNFAWKEVHDGREVFVHRKGSTPAGLNELGVIPGSMASHAFIVKGKGNPLSLSSASHGAGRNFSRTHAKRSITNSMVKRYLQDRNVTLLGGGVDESPMAYKSIDEVMRKQASLVDIVGKFMPRIVRMASDDSEE
jgi:tRNA-splicing ligase RtcB